MIGVFNKASQWVVTAILSERLLRNRVKMLTKMIKVAQFLYEMNNFHLLMAFVSALNSSAIARLKWTQSKLSRHAKELQIDLPPLFNPATSYHLYGKNITSDLLPGLPQPIWCNKIHKRGKKVWGVQFLFCFYFFQVVWDTNVCVP
eukprot:Phypoly_transcript_09306.p1 GENE.Phypoly_transcript_09306~~Phypoly_transcript_09306.p1  ORF type:complete len:146 (+),score=21.37 Phypoly_transcript_09306:950-1387(+)